MANLRRAWAGASTLAAEPMLAALRGAGQASRVAHAREFAATQGIPGFGANLDSVMSKTGNDAV